MEEDSRNKRLRSYVRFFLRREGLEKKNEQSRDEFLFKKESTKLRESQTTRSENRQSPKSRKDKFLNERNKARIKKKIEEEIGRNYHTLDTNGYEALEVYDDISTELYPFRDGYFASVENKKMSGSKKEKIFATEEEANVWLRINAAKLSKVFTRWALIFFDFLVRSICLIFL